MDRRILLVCFLFIGCILGKYCIETFETMTSYNSRVREEFKRPGLEAIKVSMNLWLEQNPDVNIIGSGLSRSDDEIYWYHTGYFLYEC